MRRSLLQRRGPASLRTGTGGVRGRSSRMGAALVLLALLSSAGCMRSEAGDHTIVRFWAFGREGEVVRELVPEFEKRHPEIRVEVQQIPWTAAHEKLLTAYVGD